MTWEEASFVAGTLAVVALLSLRFWPSSLQGPPERSFPGHGIEVEDLAERIQSVRQHYARLARRRPASESKGRRVAAKRRGLRLLGFFLRRAQPPAAVTEMGR